MSHPLRKPRTTDDIAHAGSNIVASKLQLRRSSFGSAQAPAPTDLREPASVNNSEKKKRERNKKEKEKFSKKTKKRKRKEKSKRRTKKAKEEEKKKKKEKKRLQRGTPRDGSIFF